MSNSVVISCSFLDCSGLHGRHEVPLQVDVLADGIEAHVNEVLAPLLHVGLVHVEDVDLTTFLLLEHLE